jgi:hypothetical protein
MQFPKVIVDFCLDAAGPSAIRDSKRPFRQGMAYMALSRSNCVAIQGHITLELLNNVNQSALDYWIRKVQEWSSAGDSKKKLYRDGIHAHNDFCLQQLQHAQQSAKRLNHSVRVSAPVPDTALDVAVRPAATDFVSDGAIPFFVPANASVLDDGLMVASQPAVASDHLQNGVDIDIDDAPTPSKSARAPVPVPPTLAFASFSAPAPDPAPVIGPSPALASESSSSSAPAPARNLVPAPALSKARQILPTPFTSRFIPPSILIAQTQAPAQDQAPPVTLKRQAAPPNPSCPPSVFPATKTFSSTKKRKHFPTIQKVGDLIEV